MFDQIRSNQRRSAVLVVVMAALLMGMGYALGEVFAPGAGLGGLGIAFAVWVVLTVVAYSQGDLIFLNMAGAREVRREDFPQLVNVVEEMALAAGLPKPPRVFVIDDPAPNAFATGRNPQNAAVAATTGLLERLDRDELQGVIAHEIGHIRNRDILFMLMVGVMMGAIVLLADVAVRSMFRGRVVRRTSSRRGGGGAEIAVLLVGVLLMILAPILAQVIYFACSRRREYLADASGALFTRYPEGLARALEKISGGLRAPMASANRVTAPMFIVNPMQRFVAAFSGGVFSTHPPTRERIQILRSMGGGASLADYDRAFRAARAGPSHGRGGVIGVSSLRAAPAEVPVRDPAPGDASTHVARARATTDLLWSLDGYAILPCACGVKIKVPRDFRHPQVTCPRCGTVHRKPGT